VKLAGLMMVATCDRDRLSVFDLSEARPAFERSMARGKRGKVVLRVVDE
jgi:hypothetical protein